MIHKSAIFSEDRIYRYTLERTWNKKRGIVNFIMLNPSTADENYEDPTISRCMKFAEAWGYGGIFITNVFAYRSTEAKVLKVIPDPVGKDNDSYIYAVSAKAKITITAWGNKSKFPDKYKDRDFDVFALLSNIHYLTLTKSGEPGHPLFLKGDLKPIPWN